MPLVAGPRRWSVVGVRPCRWPCAGRWWSLSLVAGYWYGGQPCRQCRPVGGRSAGGGRSASGRQCSPRPVGGRSVVAGGVGRPVGRPVGIRHKYVRTGDGTVPRKRAAVAGGGVPVYANTSLRCLISKFFIFLFFIFLFWDTETSP